jgi:hypothetical protein
VVYVVYRGFAAWWERAGELAGGGLLFELLLLGLALDVLAYLFFVVPADALHGYAVPLTPVLFFAALITGMWWQHGGIPTLYLRGLVPLAVVLYGIAFLGQAFRAPAPDLKPMVAFLKGKKLTEGYGTEPIAELLTVTANGDLDVYPIVKGLTGRMEPTVMRSSSRWYDQNAANFLVFGPDDYYINPKLAQKTWGRRTTHMELVGFDRVWIWPNPIKFVTSDKGD